MQQYYDDTSLSALSQYIAEVWSVEKLSAEEEAKLLARVQRGKAEQDKNPPNQWVLQLALDARNQLVENYQPLVVFLAKKYVYRCRHLDVLDLVQEGNLGFIEAIERAHEKPAFPLRVLASHGIRDALWTAVWHRDQPMHVSYEIAGWLSRADKIRRRLAMEGEMEPTPEQLAAEMHLKEDGLHRLLVAEQSQQMSSLQALTEDGHVEEWVEFVSLFQASVAAETERQTALEGAVREAMEAMLTERQQAVITLRYGLQGQCCTVRDAAEVLGIRAANCQKIEAQARTKLRSALAPLYSIAQEELSA